MSDTAPRPFSLRGQPGQKYYLPPPSFPRRFSSEGIEDRLDAASALKGLSHEMDVTFEGLHGLF
jgi:hypothetical protein